MVKKLYRRLRYWIKRFIWWIESLFGRKPEFEITGEFQKALDILENTSESALITGKAGTGKSALLRYFMKNTAKKYAIIAPTGVAAQNVDGSTVHSFFHFPLNISAERVRQDRMLVDKFMDIDMIIIDEVSMVRPDVMECIDRSLRINKFSNSPFGGVQMVFVGDLYQLPPVITEGEERDIVRRYGGIYFFHSPVFQKGFRYKRIELTKVFRQSQEQSHFKDILNHIRTNTALPEDLKAVNERNERTAGIDEKAIIITAKKEDAVNRNAEKLSMLKGELYTFLCEYAGDYATMANNKPEDLPAPILLKVKVKAHVMMTNNDPGNRWANGSIGIIERIEESCVWVKFENGKHQLVEKMTWENKDPSGNVTGYYKQLPMQLAYAITIHKSQGKTFDSIRVNICSGAWAHGQTYVALSRCRTLEGITLLTPITGKDIIVDPVVTAFLDDGTITISVHPQFSIREILDSAISGNRRIRMMYKNAEEITSEKVVGRLSYANEEKTVFKGFYDGESHPRNFKVNSIMDIMVL